MSSLESFDTYSPKDKKQKHNQDLSNVESFSELLKKPTSLIIIILLCVILGMTLQFGQIQSQITSMTKQLGKETSSEKKLESKFSQMQTDVKGYKKFSEELEGKVSELQGQEENLEEHDKNYRKELNNLENKNGNGGWVDSASKDNKSDNKDEDDKGFFSFLDNLFGDEDNAVNESPDEKKAKGAKDPFFGFPAFPNFETGPVQHPHSSINDLFQNIAKPGPHPKFNDQNDESSPVQELKDTNKKPELTEKDKASGIVSDISAHNLSVHHSAPLAPPVIEAPKPVGPVKIKLINPMKKTLEVSDKRDKQEKGKKKDLAPRKIK